MSVPPDKMVTVPCTINCTGINFATTGCSVQPNAIVIVPSDRYEAYEVCKNSHFNNREDYNVSASCEYNSTQFQSFCNNMDIIMYNVTLRNFNASSLKEFVVLCGISLNDSSSSITFNGLRRQKVVIKVQGQFIIIQSQWI